MVLTFGSFTTEIHEPCQVRNEAALSGTFRVLKGCLDRANCIGNVCGYQFEAGMAKSVKGTQTEKNLLTSFAGESQARMRYTYFASVAKKEGYEQIAAIFTETADQEKEHAKRMFKWLEGGMVEITASYPAGVIGTTLENLQEAAAGEHEEWSLDYPKFADIADEEGFPEIALMYRNIAIAEKGHEERYRAFIQNIETASVFAKEGEVVWQCRNCGFIYTGKEAPQVCPACLHPQAYFEVKKSNY